MLRNFASLMMPALNVPRVKENMSALFYFAEPINDTLDRLANYDITTDR